MTAHIPFFRTGLPETQTEDLALPDISAFM